MVESRVEAEARAPEFGRRFLKSAGERFPGLQDGMMFLRWSTQPADVYAVYFWRGAGIGVQIDPDLEYLIVWDGHLSAEFGDWDGDPVPQALEFVAGLIEAMGDPSG